MKHRLVILLFGISLCLPAVIFAETIVLKSGKTVEGTLIEKTDKYIKIDFDGVGLTYFFDEIKSIDGNVLTPKSLDTSKEVVSEKENNTKIVFQEGYSFLTSGRYQQAVDCYQKAIAIDPNYAEAYAYLGLAYTYLQQPVLAKENFLKSKELSKGKALSDKISFVDKYLSDMIGEEDRIKEVDELANQFWSFRIFNFFSKLVNKYRGVPALLYLFILIPYIIQIALIVLVTFFSLRLFKYRVPFPIVFVFGLTISIPVGQLLFYLWNENLVKMLSYVINRLPYAESTVASLLGFQPDIKAMEAALVVSGIKVFVWISLYLIAGIFLLSLQSWAKKFLLWLLGVCTVLELLSNIFLTNRAFGFFENLIIFVIASFCLKQEYFTGD